MESIAITPNQDDILCGSCSHTFSHKGNEKFGLIVAKHFHEYFNAVSKKGKMRVAEAILFEVIDSGAQFLKKDKFRHYWYIPDVKVGKDKISHALRIMKRAKENRERARASQQQPRPPSPNHNYADVSELDRQAQQQAPPLLQQQQAPAHAAASMMSRAEPIILPRPEQQNASSQQPTMRQTGHVKISDSDQQQQRWSFGSLDDWSDKTFIDSDSRMNVVEFTGNHQQQQSGNGISSDDGSVTTSDARGSSILDAGIFAYDQQQRQSWNESSSPSSRTSANSISSMDDDEFSVNRWIGQIIGSGTTSDARGSSILDAGMFADDQHQRQTWNESSSPAILTSANSISSMDDDEFSVNHWIGKIIGSGTTSDARDSSMLDASMFAFDQQQRQTWSESSSPEIFTSADSFSPRDDDEFADNRLIGQLIPIDWLPSFQDVVKVGQLQKSSA